MKTLLEEINVSSGLGYSVSGEGGPAYTGLSSSTTAINIALGRATTEGLRPESLFLMSLMNPV